MADITLSALSLHSCVWQPDHDILETGVGHYLYGDWNRVDACSAAPRIFTSMLMVFSVL